jgi:hypothetical protein
MCALAWNGTGGCRRFARSSIACSSRPFWNAWISSAESLAAGRWRRESLALLEDSARQQQLNGASEIDVDHAVERIEAM